MQQATYNVIPLHPNPVDSKPYPKVCNIILKVFQLYEHCKYFSDQCHCLVKRQTHVVNIS